MSDPYDTAPSLPTAISMPTGQMVVARDFVVRRTELVCPAGGRPAGGGDGGGDGGVRHKDRFLRMMAKAAASNADQVIFDLEDGCAVSQKVAARATVAEALNTLDFGGKIRTFRPNNIGSKFFYRDLIEVVEAAGANLDGVVIPKVNGPEDVLFVDRFLTQIELNLGFVPGRIKIEALIESAEAVLHAEQIAKATPRMSGLIFGTVDYAGDIGAQETGAEQFYYFNYAKAKTVTAARAAGITCLDGVTLAIRDLEACRRDSEMAARMGFDGKWAIYPPQVDVINAVFTPTADEIAKAERILDAYERADVDQGVGAIVVDDEMVDAATLRIEWKKLAIARKAGLATSSARDTGEDTNN